MKHPVNYPEEALKLQFAKFCQIQLNSLRTSSILKNAYGAVRRDMMSSVA